MDWCPIVNASIAPLQQQAASTAVHVTVRRRSFRAILKNQCF